MFKGLELLNDLVVPLVSAQFYFVFLLYFVVAGKQLTKQYRFYILFLLGFIFFILTRTAAYFFTHELFWAIRYIRIPVLFILAAPCLVIATARHCRFDLNRWMCTLLVLTGTVSSVVHSVLTDLGRGERGELCQLGWVPASVADVSWITAGVVQTLFRVLGGIVLFVVPYVFLLVKELRGEKRTNPLSFIFGTLLFGILFVVGNYTRFWGIYYLGSLVCAGFWGWAIFSHIREMRDFGADVMKERVDVSTGFDKSQEAVSVDAEDERLRVLTERAKEFICTQYQNDLSVEDIARNAGVSSSHFSRLFKKYSGQTAKQYLTQVRMEHAKMLLLKKSVTDTAFSVGFNDSNYFSTVFKKHTGHTPTEFQQSFRAPSS